MSNKMDKKERKAIKEKLEENLNDVVKLEIGRLQELFKEIAENQAALNHNGEQQGAILNALIEKVGKLEKKVNRAFS